MNQLQEFLDEFENTKFMKGGGACFECCDYEEMCNELRAFLKFALSKYARSVIPEKLEMPTGDAMRFAYDKEHYTGYNHCIREIKSNIGENIESLKK